MNTFNYIVKFILITLIVIGAYSCIETIDIDLNSSNPVVTTEGQIELDSVAWISINHTTDFFDPDIPPAIDDAIVTLYSSSGENEILQNVGSGYYLGNTILGKIGDSYSITIENNDFNYTANSKLFAPCEIIDVKFEKNKYQYEEDIEEMDTAYTTTIIFTDDPDTENFYLVKYWGSEVDAEEYEDLNYYYTLVEDKYYVKDGKIELDSWFQDFYRNTKVKIAVYSIDEDTYTYHYQLNDINSGGGSTPYNPQSNFGTDAMGYFVAWSNDTWEGITPIGTK